MEIDAWILPILAEHRHLIRLPSGIYSAPESGRRISAAHDARAAAYDRLISSRWYNRLMWGTSPERYEAFAREASIGQGPVLDAGCGTMSATAKPLRRCNRAIVGVDTSMSMLERAKARTGASPLIAHVQADVFRMPFVGGSFETVIGMGTLHLFDDADSYLDELKRMAMPGGRIFVSALALCGRKLGDAYLKSLARAGEIAEARTREQSEKILQRLGRLVSVRMDGNMLYAVIERAAETRTCFAETALSRGQLL